MKYAGANWLANSYAPNISQFGREVADIIGAVWRGIYHLNDSELRRPDWADDTAIEIVVRGELATFDGSELTVLVLMAHDRNIRVAVHGQGYRYLRVAFMRMDAGLTIAGRHPRLEDAAARYRELIGHELAPRPEPKA